MDNVNYIYNLRSGKHVNIIEELKEIEEKYRADLNADIDAFTTYEEVQAETFNDQVTVEALLDIMCKFGYLEVEECAELHEIIAKIRLEVLDEKLKGDEEDGSKN